MKKFRIAFLTLTIFLTSIANVRAACTMEETSRLNTLGANIGVDYEIIQKAVQPEPDFNPPDGLTEEEMNEYVYNKQYYRIRVSNVTEDLYVVLQKDNTKEKKTYNYSEAVNGVISIDEPVSTLINNYTITVYSSSKTNCPDTKLATRYITTPMFNDLSNSVLCEGIEEFYLCHKYLSVSTSFENYEDLMNKYRQGKLNEKGEEIKKEEQKGNFSTFIKEHRALVAIAVVVVIAAGGLVTVIIVKKQRSRVI
ncbi:MAG: hypothetical protein NC483_04210 [Ruminococcus sp.]|nr:hypothetical protein [Ruminococcus sp.]